MNNNNNNNNIINIININGLQVVRRLVVPVEPLRNLLPPWAVAWPADGFQGYSCLVCYKPLVHRTAKIGRMPCKHVVCYECMEKWFELGGDMGQTCPYCRTPYEVAAVDIVTIDD